MKNFTLKSAAALFMLLLSQNMMATGFTNVYAHAEVSETGAGEIYITSDDPDPTLVSERGESTEAQFTTGTDGDQEWVDTDGSNKKRTIYWGTVFVAPTPGYKCLGLVNEVYDTIDEYSDDNFLRGKIADSDGEKNKLIKWDDTDNSIIEALCNPEKGVKVNMNFDGVLEEKANSNNFPNDGEKPAAELARDAARAQGFDAEPNVMFYALMVEDEGYDPAGVKDIKVVPVSVKKESYDLAGRRVNKSQKGIVINNGKKFLNK